MRNEAAETFERMEAVGYGSQALESPWWPQVWSWVDRTGREYVRALILYTTREQAEEDRRRLEEFAPEDYMKLVDVYGEADVNEAFDSTAPYRTLWVDQDTLLNKLGNSDFLFVMVDGTLKPRGDFMEELRGA
jgi:hypothetical protein